MKKVILASAVLVIFAACNDQSKQSDSTITDTVQNNSTTTTTETKPVSVDGIVTTYLQLKNALVNDNSKEAADAGRSLANELSKIDSSGLTPEQKKVYDDVKEDLREHAEHIAANSDKISHQREHFNWLSDVVYSLVKGFKTDKLLYKDHCPMFNDGKGANWLSEIKEIKNPYYGKKMITCGVIKEEIK